MSTTRSSAGAAVVRRLAPVLTSDEIASLSVSEAKFALRSAEIKHNSHTALAHLRTLVKDHVNAIDGASVRQFQTAHNDLIALQAGQRRILRAEAKRVTALTSSTSPRSSSASSSSLPTSPTKGSRTGTPAHSPVRALFPTLADVRLSPSLLAHLRAIVDAIDRERSIAVGRN